MNQLKDTAIVLSRIDYGERDRILTLLCANAGKISVLAKGVRSAKSRLAGGIELLSESEVSYIAGKSSLKTLTSARLHVHFGELVQDVRRMQQAFSFLKIVNSVADDDGGQEFYGVLLAGLRSLNDGSVDTRIVDVWFGLQMMAASGTGPNLEFGAEATSFEFNYDEQKFVVSDNGLFTVNDLKVLRLCLTSSRPPRLSSELGSETQLQLLVQALLKTNLTEL